MRVRGETQSNYHNPMQATKKAPIVSIIITAYNMEKYLEQAVRSAAEQTYDKLRIYIVDDCSTDTTAETAVRLADELNTPDAAHALGREAGYVRILQHDRNAGAGQARRTGINAALADGTDFILTLDADDWLDTDFIASLVRKHEETEAPIVSGGISVERGNGYWEKTCYGDCVTEGLERVTKFWGEKIVFMNNKIIHRSIAEKVPYCTRRFVEDTPTIIPMLYHADKVAYCPNTGYHYRMQEDSLTHTSSPLRWAIYRALCADDLMRFFEQQPDKDELLKTIPLGVSFSQQIAALKQLNPTAADVKPYQADFAELCIRIIQRLN